MQFVLRFQRLLLVCVILAMILSTVGVLLFTSIVNKELRQVSAVWYLYHIIPICLVTGFILHPLTFFGTVQHSSGACYFVMYTAEYMFFGIGIHLILFNIEVYFTKVLPLQRWQTCMFYRFVILTLVGWLIASLLVTHVVIDNNYAKVAKRSSFCVHIKNPTVRLMRVLLREMLSASVCVVMTIVTIATMCLKKSRRSNRWRSEEFRDISVNSPAEELQWVRCIVFVNSIWLVRAICMAATHVTTGTYITSPGQLKFVGVLLKIHAASLYLIPFAVLFIEDARKTLKVLLSKLLHVASFGHLRFGEELETLSVSFGNVNVPEHT